MEPDKAAFALAVGAVVVGFLIAPPSEQEGNKSRYVGEPGSAHVHAHLFFAANGSEKVLEVERIRGSERVHFHGDDSILHVHAENVDLDFSLEKLGVGVNSTCLEFRPGDDVFCSGGGVGVRVNGENLGVDEALSRVIQQDDTIVVWAGEEPGEFERELPPQYQESVPGSSV